ncbi:diacylglycerol/lipid kinase family protein [Streptococcus didelphis]|uniref:diacylglycerol/lipid kinase family protein n=1 Tax=Streptococcus didelphis TaxID=102886 RepID=UPI000365DC83|nr:diacylglycerol kinase family protein [Streptococcus didelphis]
MKSVAIFFNPKSGKKKDNLAEEVKEALVRRGFLPEDISIIIPESADHAFSQARKVSSENIDLIIPLGGDGTISKIIGGVYEGGKHSKIGLIPSGTVNNFAKALHIPLEFDSALDNIVNGHDKKIDICKVKDHQYMISSLTLGLLADIAADVTPEEKRKFGPFAFLKDSYRILKQNRSYSIIIQNQEFKMESRTKFLLITMTNTIAGFPSFSPDALVDDGLLQVYTMKKLSFFKFLFHINEFRRGDFSKAEEISHFHCHSLELLPLTHKKSSRPRTRIDGDKSSAIPLSLEVLQKAVTVIVP